MDKDFTLEQFENMKFGDNVSIPIGAKATGKLWILQMELESMNMLYDSYIRRNGKLPENNLNFDEFLGRYTGVAAQYTAALSQAILEKLGEETAQLLLCPGKGFYCFFQPTPDTASDFVDGGDQVEGSILVVKRCPPPLFWETKKENMSCVEVV